MREGNNGRGVFWFIPYTLAGVDYGQGKLYDSVINEIVPFESGFPWRQKPEKNREPLMWPIRRQKICAVAVEVKVGCNLGTGHVRWAARANVCSTLMTSSKIESERFVVRKERAARNAGQPTISISRTVRSWARAGSVPCSVVGLNVQGIAGQGIYVRIGDERCVCLVELIDAKLTERR
jgi:hypothetical protein